MNLTKADIYTLLNTLHISYESYEHNAVYSIEDLAELDIPHKEWIVKSLFLRDDKSINFYLVTVPGYTTVNLKKLSKIIASRRLSFANEDILFEMLALRKGYVTPLGVLNNTQKNVFTIFDNSLREQKIGIHPMVNTATVFLAFEDVLKLIEDYGNSVIMCDIE